MLGQDPRRERQQRTEAGETAVWQAEVLDAQSVAPATEWEPTVATLEDTYPPAAGILLQKLSEFCQKDVPRSFTPIVIFIVQQQLQDLDLQFFHHCMGQGTWTLGSQEW